MDFNNLLIGSENPEPLAAYYTKFLGAPMYTGDGYTTWQIGSGFVTVGPHSEVKGTNTAPGRIIWNIESKEFAADFARFKAAGAVIIAAPYEFEGAPGSSIATFADPDGNYFQLTTPFDASSMG